MRTKLAGRQCLPSEIFYTSIEHGPGKHGFRQRFPKEIPPENRYIESDSVHYNIRQA